MHAYLVGTPCVDAQTEKAPFSIGKQAAKGGMCLVTLPLFAYLAKHHAVLFAANGSMDLSRFGRNALYPSQILLVDLSLPHCFRQNRRRVGVARHGHGAACFSVQASYGAKDKGGAAIKVSQGVGQGVLSVVVGGMGRHKGRLVAHHQLLVLVKNIHRQGTGQQVRIDRRLFVLYPQGKKAPLSQNGAHRHSLAIKENAVLLGL